MSFREPRILVEDMRSAARQALDYMQGLEYETFAADRMRVDAILHNLQILGEAAARLPAADKARYPMIEWPKVIGFRNVVVHEYFGVDLRLVWKILTGNLPEFLERIETGGA